MINEEELRDIYRRKKQKILKWGTYVIEDPNQAKDMGPNPEADDVDMVGDVSYDQESVKGELDMDDETRAKYEAIMPTRMEDSIQNNINAIMQEQNNSDNVELSELSEDALVAEIMKKFQNNIQNNVNELFK